MSTLNTRLANPDYKYWVKATLCLQYVKDGLENFAEEKSRDLHDAVLKEVQKQDNIFIKGLCPDSEIEFCNVRKTWTVKDCNCQDCTRCIAVIQNQVVKKGHIFLDPNVQELHDKVLQELSSYGNPSINGICSGVNLHFNRNQNKWELMYCNCNGCQAFVDEISKYRCATLGRHQTTTFTFKQSNFNNSDVQQWHTEHWPMAKLFMNQGQDVKTTSPGDTDISGLLNFIDHCDRPRAVIQNTHNIEEVRDTRNRILHTADMKITKHDFSTKIVPTLIALLQDPGFLSADPVAQDAVVKINEVAAADFIITKENEEKVLNDLATEFRCLSKDLNTKILDLRIELNRVDTTVGQKMKTQQDKLEKELQDSEKDIKTLEKRFHTLEQKVKDDDELVTKLGTDVNTIKTSLKESCEDIDKLKSRLNLVEQTCEELKQNQAEMAADIEELKDMKTETPVITEVNSQKLQQLSQYLKDGYDYNKLNVPVLSNCHWLSISEIFAPVILTKDMENSSQEEGRGEIEKSSFNKSTLMKEAREREKIRSYKAMFFKESILQKKIFLLGKAGAGKSTVCKHLTDLWCNEKVSPKFDDAEVLKLFRYLFHVSCRFAESLESIFDMICNQLLCENDEMIKVARHVLKNKPDECLVVVDGIDEWKGSASKETGRRGDIPGLPSRKGLEDCVVLSTSRPERIHMLPTKLDKTCSVLELHGIEKSEKLIYSILENIGNPDPRQSCSEFLSQIQQNNMTDLIQFPLMLINALDIWDMNETLSSSMSVNYSNMVEGLFSRAKDANRIEEHAEERRKETSAELPNCFLHMDLCKRNAGIIIRLGKLAFDLLFNDDQNSSLIFSGQLTRKYLTENELKTCLAVGILSKAQSISRISRRIDSFSFCHKTFQEFLGALWLSREQSELMGMFLRQFRSTDSLFGNKVFILFLCGLSYSAGDRFWKYIAEEVILKDEEISEFRLCDGIEYIARHKIRVLQKLVLQCNKEALDSDLGQHRQLYYLIPDIYIDKDTNERDIALINGLVEKYVTDIKFVKLHYPPPPGIDLYKTMQKMQSVIGIRLEGDWRKGVAMPELPVLQFPRQLKLLSMRCADITSAIELPSHLSTLTVKRIKLSHSSIEQLCSCLHASSSLKCLQLEGLSCSDHDDTCSDHVESSTDYCGDRCLPALNLQRHYSLETARLVTLSVESVLLPGQGIIPSRLTTLAVSNIKLSHSGIEQMFSCLRVSFNLQYLYLEVLYCSDHDDSYCLPALDLQRHHSLETVKLQRLSVESVLLPGQPERKQTGGNYEIPSLDILMNKVSMSSQGWRNWQDGLSRLSYRLKVVLWSCNIHKDLRSYIRSCSHFTVIQDDDNELEFRTIQDQ